VGSISEELATAGDALFRRRSYMPLLLVPLFVLSVFDNRPATPFAWELVCLSVALCGLLLRAFVVGTAPRGASTRGTRRPTAESLSTLGAYSIVRHPLYVANTLVALGCAMLSGTWYLPLIVLLLSFVYHERIAAREEAFLQKTFGESFRAWANDVPAMIPAIGRYRRSNVPFQWQKVIVQESHGLCAIGTAFLVLDTLEDSAKLGYFHVDPAWLAIFVITFIPFLIVVIVKKTGRRTAPI
jgi:protein-S-isoprenylcysteine O-methyltransferase Ste14